MSARTRSLFGWPGARGLCYAYGVLGPPLMVWFVMVYGGADWLTGMHDFRVRLHMSFELGIPFVPSMILFYNSMHVAYAIAPFILRDRSEMHAMALTWVAITLLAGIVFLLLPSEDAFPTPSDAALGVWRGMFRLADHANLRFNSCPSMHVAWGIVCVDVYARYASRTESLLLIIWGVGIFASTLLLHQHHIIDAIGGTLLGLFGSRILYPRLLGYFAKPGPESGESTP